MLHGLQYSMILEASLVRKCVRLTHSSHLVRTYIAGGLFIGIVSDKIHSRSVLIVPMLIIGVPWVWLEYF